MQAMEFHHVRVRPTEQIGSHEHPTWEISYVIRGHGRRQMGSEQEEFKAGEVVMVIPNLSHQWIFDAEDKERAYAPSLLLHCDYLIEMFLPPINESCEDRHQGTPRFRQ